MDKLKDQFVSSLKSKGLNNVRELTFHEVDCYEDEYYHTYQIGNFN